MREALRRLQALDIVMVRQGSGSYVGEISIQSLVEALVLHTVLDGINGAQSLHTIIDTRRALDLGIAVPLTRAMKGTTNPHLRELIEAMTEYAHSGLTYLEQDIVFHFGLLAYIEDELMHQLVAAVRFVHQGVTPQLAAASHQEMEDTAGAHTTILRACEVGDLGAHTAAVEAHYASFLAITEDRQSAQRSPERCGGELPPVSWISKLKSEEWEAFYVCGSTVEA